MNKVKIQTLTPVHIGSGNFLRNNSDFVQHHDGEDSYIYVIDPKKILDLIGAERLDDWVRQIERNEDTKEFVNRMGHNATPDKYALRTLMNYAQVHPNDTLKECMHDGMGRAYIPGSSIKGAMRTAVLATLVQCMENLESTVAEKNFKTGKTNVGAKKIEAKILGGDPNSDIFRFIKIGDAYFEEGCEISSRVINLNIRERSDLTDFSKSQIVEAIAPEYETTIQMKVDATYYNWTKNHWPYSIGGKNKPLGDLPAEISDIHSLFEIINNHTKKLVNDEIQYWQEMLNGKYEGAEDYLNNMRYILQEIDSCQLGKECVLRIGHASGWRFITGAWTEQLDNFKRDIVPASRRGNDRYRQYDFPKSRRLDEDGDIFGFVKLSVL